MDPCVPEQLTRPSVHPNKIWFPSPCEMALCHCYVMYSLWIQTAQFKPNKSWVMSESCLSHVWATGTDELPTTIKAGRHVICVRSKPTSLNSAHSSSSINDARPRGMLSSSPIVAIAASRGGEPPRILQLQLELLHLQLLAWTSQQVLQPTTSLLLFMSMLDDQYFYIPCDQ